MKLAMRVLPDERLVNNNGCDRIVECHGVGGEPGEDEGIETGTGARALSADTEEDGVGGLVTDVARSVSALQESLVPEAGAIQTKAAGAR